MNGWCCVPKLEIKIVKYLNENYWIFIYIKTKFRKKEFRKNRFSKKKFFLEKLIFEK